MDIPKLYLTLAVFIICLITTFINKKIGISILIFMVPFVLRPFVNSSISFGLGLTGFATIAVWIGLKLSGDEKISEDDKKFNINVLLFLLIYGIILGVIKGIHNTDLRFEYHATAIESLLTGSMFLVVMIMFISILGQTYDDIDFQRLLQKIFVFTMIIHFMGNIMFVLNIKSPLPSPEVMGEDTTNIGIIRLAGYIYDYELFVDYCLIVIGLSLILYSIYKNKIFLFIIIMAFVNGLLTGTRSFIVVIIIFFSIYLVMNIIIDSKKKIKNLVLFFFIIGIFYVIAEYALKNIPYLVLFDRLTDSIDLYGSGNFEGAINRPFISSLPAIINNSLLWGNGSMIINSLEGDTLVFHSLYLNIYACYGIIGVFVLLRLLWMYLKNIISLIRKCENVLDKKELIIYFSLLCALILQQGKITATRDISILLIYCFLFVNITLLIKKITPKQQIL